MLRNILMCLGLISSGAHASIDDVKISGFGSFVYFSEDVENPISSTAFSAVGLQLQKTDERFRYVLQVRALDLADWEPEINWAFVEYKFNENTYISVGRFITSFYEHSQASYVGNSYSWTRPPTSVYGIDFDSIDGASIRKEYSSEDSYSAFEISVGRRSEPYVVGGIRRDGEVSKFIGLSARFESKYVTHRFSISQSWLTYDTPFFSQLRYQDSEPPEDFLSSLDYINEFTNSVSFYTSYEKDWVVELEGQMIFVDDAYVEEDYGYYLSVGYQFDRMMPYIIYTRARTKLSNNVEQFAEQDPREFWVAAYTQFFEIAELDYDSIGAGFRYDFSKNMSASFQVEYFDSKIPKPENNTIIGSLSIDFVF